MASKISQAFKQLRVYRRLTVPLILNDMICNRIMKLSYIVEKAPFIYKLSCQLIGKNFINSLVQATYCKIFTAGNTIHQADRIAQYYRQQGIPIILDYCAEGDIHSPDLEAKLDENSRLFAQSAFAISQKASEMISIKITGLLDMRTLKKWNDAILLRDKFWKEYSRQNKLTFLCLVQGMNKYFGVGEQQIFVYLKSIHNYQGEAKDFVISEVDFKINHHPYYLFQHIKNDDSVIKLFFPLEQEQQTKIQNFKRRVVQICGPFVENSNSFKILVDAEQSYVQKGIESIYEQLQQQYNQKRAYIIPTIQNYLKRSVERAHYVILIAKYRKLKFGAKLVRGAYIVEETRLSKEQCYQSPIVDNFEQTTRNYLGNFEQILKNFEEGEVIVATHNQDTIRQSLQIKSKFSKPPVVSFAQLLGLADHLTCKLKLENHPVYKLLPWAQTQVMVPYMIRRAQQLNQMKYPLDIQFTLLAHQLWCRLTRKE